MRGLCTKMIKNVPKRKYNNLICKCLLNDMKVKGTGQLVPFLTRTLFLPARTFVPYQLVFYVL